MENEKRDSLNFIEEIIEADRESGKHGGRVHTRFPPEPNGYLHIGHCKAICLNFELGSKYSGLTNLRFDDTNPVSEDTEYVDAIKRDIKWLGYDWEDRLYFTSDYFPQLFDFALQLIDKGLAYVDESSPEEIAELKGTPTTPGKNSPYRDRSIEENRSEFLKMKDGSYEDGAKVLRAKIDMASSNMHMRDPIIYRIKHADHHRTGDAWCIYPMYDFAHGQSDSIEEITHSLCSLEFRHHRPLYDWLIEQLGIFPSRQIEFSRMNVAYMITSKRKLLKLVEAGLVSGWDDPRMPTVSGMRRKGYPAEAIRTFCDKVGMTKRENLIEVELLESCVRDVLNQTANRVMVIEDPLKLVIENYPDGQTELLKADNNPEDPESGTRDMHFSKSIFIERGDFMLDPPKKYFRLAPERTVRLKNAYIISYESHEEDEAGNITQVNCKYYENSKSGEDVSGIKTKGVLHWVDGKNNVPITINNFGRLFTDPNPTGHEDKDFMEFVNKDSLDVNVSALAEGAVSDATPGQTFQFFRKGYYCLDQDTGSENLIFNKTISLKDSWSKVQKKN